MKPKGTLTEKQRIDYLESEIEKLQQELWEAIDKLNDLLAAQSTHNKFGPIKMKEEPHCPL